MSNIVPDISSGVVIGRELKTPQEAADGHVILLGIETAETEVCKQLRIVDSNLQEPPERERERERDWV